MVKGSQKRVIHIKNTHSGIFEEAYFILKEGADTPIPESDMISEANRIIEENSRCDEAMEKRSFSSGMLKLIFSLLVTVLAAASAVIITLAVT